MNEWYSRDISKKRRLTNIVKGNAGEPLTKYMYGYVQDPADKKRWVIDPEAAEVVRRIYSMTLDGKGTEQIADALTQDRILTPMFYWKSKGMNPSGKMPEREPHKWNSSTVIKILSAQEYCGDVINFKTLSKSFKLKERIPNTAENRAKCPAVKKQDNELAVFRDAHEAIVDRAAWERIQEKRGKVRKRKTADGEKNMFSGLLVCADCGHNLWYHFNQRNPGIKYFNCSNYKGNRGTCETTHHIRVDFLEQVLLQEIRRLTKYASKHENEFLQAIAGYAEQSTANERQRKQKELTAMLARDRELDRLFNRMYEDNVNGRVDDERYAKMTRQYTEEQRGLAEKITALTAELDRQAVRAMTTDMFVATVRRYTRAKKLTERMLTELIERVEVHQSEKVDGVHVQRLTIHYACVGAIDIPAGIELPEILFQPRKGVSVSYSVI